MNSPHENPGISPIDINDLHSRACQYVGEWDLPSDRGLVIFFEGRLCGWICDLSADRAPNGHLTHRPGCVAVELRTKRVFFSEGGTYDAGALRWTPFPTTPGDTRSGVSSSASA